jgi:2,4-dienoyl-CoA reductase-like NADH-dependent reductase (Old Yellow Enzyme family)
MEAFRKWHSRIFGYDGSTNDIDLLVEYHRRMAAFGAGMLHAAKIAENAQGTVSQFATIKECSTYNQGCRRVAEAIREAANG